MQSEEHDKFIKKDSQFPDLGNGEGMGRIIALTIEIKVIKTYSN